MALSNVFPMMMLKDNDEIVRTSGIVTSSLTLMYHGYGLKNINRIVQENHGDFYTKKKDGVFTVQVRLNCEN